MSKLILFSVLFALCAFVTGIRPAGSQPALSTATQPAAVLTTGNNVTEYTILEQLIGGVGGTTLQNSSGFTRGDSSDIDKNPLVPLIFAFGWIEKNKDDLDKDGFDEVLFKNANLVSFSGNMAQIFNSTVSGEKREVRLLAPSDPEDEEITLNVVGK